MTSHLEKRDKLQVTGDKLRTSVVASNQSPVTCRLLRCLCHLSRLSGLLVTVLLAGCVTFPHAAAPRAIQPLSKETVAYYRHTPQSITAHLEPLSSGEPSGLWEAQRIRLDVPGLPHPIRLDWYAPRDSQSHQGRHVLPAPARSAGGGRRAAVLIFPILWGNDLGVRDFARAFAREGIHGVIIYRPKEKFAMEKPLSQLEEHLRESVLHARHALDWLETQGSVDPTRIGSLGISMGAALNILVASVEPRLTRYVFCLPACNLAHVIMTTKDRSIAKKRDEYLRRHGLTASQAEASLTTILRSEPLALAPSIDPSRCLLVIALGDRVIGWRNSLAIWRVLGRPPTTWLPTGHYSAILALPYVQWKALRFFADWRRPEHRDK